MSEKRRGLILPEDLKAFHVNTEVQQRAISRLHLLRIESMVKQSHQRVQSNGECKEKLRLPPEKDQSDEGN